ncbi:MAG: EamA family transporter [Planctomycetaceae bacterium]
MSQSDQSHSIAPKPAPAQPALTAALPVTGRMMLLGLFAAAAYSIANMALRQLARTDGGTGWDMWVAGTKAFPTFFIAVTLIAWRRFNGLHSFAEWSFVWPIAVAAIFNQLGGNLPFQMSLRVIGLAVSVPICFASIICSGAVVGRIVLGDQVSVRSAISMGLMVAAIVFLSSGASSRSTAPVTPADITDEISQVEPRIQPTALDSSAGPGVAIGVLLSIISGLCYGITGVYIRKAVRSHMPVAATLFLFSSAGFLILVPGSLLLLPLSEISSTSPEDWATIAIAGTFNAIGFFAITHAMRFLTISRANVINASQNAMCAVGAVTLFGEQLSWTATAGICLTITGLLTLDRR